jgi:hypothetical protein
MAKPARRLVDMGAATMHIGGYDPIRGECARRPVARPCAVDLLAQASEVRAAREEARDGHGGQLGTAFHPFWLRACAVRDASRTLSGLGFGHIS